MVRHFAIAFLLFLAISRPARAQEEVLTGAFGNATDFKLFWTQVGVTNGDFKPERSAGARGIGFEVAFQIPGGINRTLNAPRTRSSQPEGTDCESRFKRGELTQGADCADTTVLSVKRIRARRDTSYEEVLKIDPFAWHVPALTLELAIGFSQTGAYVSRFADNNMRVSLREFPSVSLYANYRPKLPTVGRVLETYLGLRSGLITMIGGQALGGGEGTKLNGETFQIGPVAGISTELRGVNLFVEGAWMSRNFSSVDWDSHDGALGRLPRSINMSGRSLAVGIQFEFRRPDFTEEPERP